MPHTICRVIFVYIQERGFNFNKNIRTKKKKKKRNVKNEDIENNSHTLLTQVLFGISSQSIMSNVDFLEKCSQGQKYPFNTDATAGYV